MWRFRSYNSYNITFFSFYYNSLCRNNHIGNTTDLYKIYKTFFRHMFYRKTYFIHMSGNHYFFTAFTFSCNNITEIIDFYFITRF